MNDPERPVGCVLLLGPTGTGKTRLVEAVCEVMFADAKGLVKIDCGEFKHSHEMSKIIGAPPGYLGHDSANKQITQERLNKTHNDEVKLSVLLFDEIEKAHPDFWDFLLGTLDKGRFTDNKGSEINLTHTLIFMTSNLGAREVQDSLDGGIGFITPVEIDPSNTQRISEVVAKKKFTPEFMNRLDHIITFQHLNDAALAEIVNIEINHIQRRILTSDVEAKFAMTCSAEVKKFLLSKGIDQKYGARHLKRTLEKYLVNPLVSLILTAQIALGDLIEVVLVDDTIKFYKIPANILAELKDDEWKDFKKASDE